MTSESTEYSFGYQTIMHDSQFEIKLQLPLLDESFLPFFSKYSLSYRSANRSNPIDQTTWKQNILSIRGIKRTANVVKQHIVNMQGVEAGLEYTTLEAANNEWKNYSFHKSVNKLKDRICQDLPPFLNSPGRIQTTFHVGIHETKNHTGLVIGSRFANHPDFGAFDELLNDFLSKNMFPPLPEYCCQVTWKPVNFQPPENPRVITLVIM